MWILLWVMVSANGGSAAGTQEFPTKEACEAALETMLAMQNRASEARQVPTPGTGIRCIQKATGKP